MTVVKTLSPSLMSVLVEQVAQGNLNQASVISNINAGLPISYSHASAAFTKQQPGVYKVLFYRDGAEVGGANASSPVEAKLLVLDYVVKAAKEVAKA